MVFIPKNEFVKEHTHLVDLLQKGNKTERVAEAKKQSKELQNVIHTHPLDGGSRGSFFVARMMAEAKLKHKGVYKNPTAPLDPKSTMNAPRPFDLKLLANSAQKGKNSKAYGASPFILAHFGNAKGMKEAEYQKDARKANFQKSELTTVLEKRKEEEPELEKVWEDAKEKKPLKEGKTAWLNALLLWNSRRDKWMVPRKGTPEYEEVKKLMAPKKGVTGVTKPQTIATAKKAEEKDVSKKLEAILNKIKHKRVKRFLYRVIQKKKEDVGMKLHERNKKYAPKSLWNQPVTTLKMEFAGWTPKPVGAEEQNRNKALLVKRDEFIADMTKLLKDVEDADEKGTSFYSMDRIIDQLKKQLAWLKDSHPTWNWPQK